MTYALANFPGEAHLAFVNKGKAMPTTPLQPTQGQEELEPGRTLNLTKMHNGQWWLLETETMEPVLRIKADTQNHTEGRIKVTTVCHLPKMEEEPDVTAGESILMVELTPRSWLYQNQAREEKAAPPIKQGRCEERMRNEHEHPGTAMLVPFLLPGHCH